MEKLSVIITTYNKKEWLRKVLIGFSNQTNRNFEVIIADDGSREDTKQLIEEVGKNSYFNIQHVWHDDNGFQKCAILNKAIIESKYDYLLFTDDDCIPRTDFVDIHLKYAEKGYFLSGGYFKLNSIVTEKITDEDILTQNIFNIKWLISNGQDNWKKLVKLTRSKHLALFMTWITPTRATWNGHNVSGFKSDIIRVNGYNEDMAYGGLDRELGERLVNSGIKAKQVRYKAICVHLDHARPYEKKDMVIKNHAIRKNVRDNKITLAENGIDKYFK